MRQRTLRFTLRLTMIAIAITAMEFGFLSVRFRGLGRDVIPIEWLMKAMYIVAVNAAIMVIPVLAGAQSHHRGGGH